MLWALDEALIHPILIPKLAVLGNITLGAIQSPAINPSRVRIHRDHSLSDGHLLAADITADVIDVRIRHNLIKAPLQDPLERQATYVLREVQRSLAILGQGKP
ncbi:hypothetical protein AB0K40_18100 [Nonomuraea bangladeshensis]|uniref:Uncharacterized protein n=1 Tax=Nonomuraea bangladeshensis TaxID=404385 RepID=A0ABV3H4F9_9ACTN